MNADLLAAQFCGQLQRVCQEPSGHLVSDRSTPQVLFPGSFNPLHSAHCELAEVAARCLGHAVEFEISISNVDKPQLSEAETRRRLTQFLGRSPIWVTTAATFQYKAMLFPACTFVVGFDTAARLIDRRYYGDEVANRDACLRNLLEQNCKFLVGGRIVGGRFQVWDASLVNREFRKLFISLSEADFRNDLSSTELRLADEQIDP